MAYAFEIYDLDVYSNINSLSNETFKCFILYPMDEIISTIYPVMHSSVHQSLVVVTTSIIDFPKIYRYKDSEILKAPIDSRIMRRTVDYPFPL